MREKNVAVVTTLVSAPSEVHLPNSNTVSSTQPLTVRSPTDVSTLCPSTPTSPTYCPPQDDKTTVDPGSSEGGGAGRPYTKYEWYFVAFSLYLALFLYGLDNTIVADIQPAAVEAFGNISLLSWLGSGFPLGAITAILPLGKAYSLFDQKTLFLASLAMFLGGSAVCGGATSMIMLIGGRVWAGVGGAGLYLGILNIASRNTTARERPMYMSLTGLTWGVGCIVGPIVGGGFADSPALTWRWAFWINLVLLAVLSPAYLWYLKRDDPAPHLSFRQKLRSMDWLGMVLYLGIYVCIAVGLTFGGVMYAWTSVHVILPIVFFVLIMAVFLAQQFLCIGTDEVNRLFPVDFLLSRTLMTSYVASAALSAGLLVPVFYVPLFFSFAHGDSHIQAAMRLLPFVVVTVVAMLVNGWAMPRWGTYMPWFLASGVFLVVGGALMFTIDEKTPLALIYLYLVLTALGAGLGNEAGFSVVQCKVCSDPGTATADHAAHNVNSNNSNNNNTQILSPPLLLPSNNASTTTLAAAYGEDKKKGGAGEKVTSIPVSSTEMFPSSGHASSQESPVAAGRSRMADCVGFICSAQLGAVMTALTISGCIFQNLGAKSIRAVLSEHNIGTTAAAQSTASGSAAASAGLAFTQDQIREALSGKQSHVFQSVSADVQAELVKALVTTISRCYITLIVAGAVTLVCALLMKQERLIQKKTDTDDSV